MQNFELQKNEEHISIIDSKNQKAIQSYLINTITENNLSLLFEPKDIKTTSKHALR